MKKRKQNRPPQGPRVNGQWEVLTGWADDAIEEEGEEDERLGTDGDVLGEVTSALKRQRSASVAGEVPFEQQWEAEMTSFKPGSVRRSSLYCFFWP
jgi:WD repeat-containing protein 48